MTTREEVYAYCNTEGCREHLVVAYVPDAGVKYDDEGFATLCVNCEQKMKRLSAEQRVINAATQSKLDKILARLPKGGGGD